MQNSTEDDNVSSKVKRAHLHFFKIVYIFVLRLHDFPLLIG